jgi:hypothetical protein
MTAAVAVTNRMEDPVKLTDTQVVLLSAASQRDDRALERPSELTGGAAGKVVAKLLSEGLIEEIQSRGSLPVWCRDEDGPRSLRITKNGLKVIQVEEDVRCPGRVGASASHARAGALTFGRASRCCQPVIWLKPDHHHDPRGRKSWSGARLDVSLASAFRTSDWDKPNCRRSALV